MSIFDSLRVYASKWSVKEQRSFTPEELNLISLAVVVPSDYGCSVEFSRKGGGKMYIPLSNDATVAVGEVIDLSKAVLVTLYKDGEDDIYRVMI